MKPDHFLAQRQVFTRQELERALPGRSPGTLSAHLNRWRRQGRIARVKNGLFVRVEGAGGADVDFLALAGRMAPDAVVAYHTAMEALGCAQSLFRMLTFLTRTRVRPVDFQGHRFVPVRPRAVVEDLNEEPWVEVLDRDGLEVRVTSPERTLVDVLDRPDLAGGIEEVWRSLAALPAIDPVALWEYVRRLGRGTVAARVGYFLESRREELAVPEQTLAHLRGLLPHHPVYMDRALGGKLDSRWRIYVPLEVAEPPGEVGT